MLFVLQPLATFQSIIPHFLAACSEGKPEMSSYQRKVPGFLSESQFARLVGLTEWGLRAWRRREYGPPATKIGRGVFYRQEDVDAFLLKPSDTNN